MSRCSLRLSEGLLDSSLPHGSASYSVGGLGSRSSRSARTRHSSWRPTSCSKSVLVSSPRKAAAQSLHNSSLQSAASDASLMSSLLDESSIQERTLVDTFWGLDQDADPRESTIMAEERTLIGSESQCAKHLDQNHTVAHCKDCSFQSEQKADDDTSTIYCRERRRRSRTDVLQLLLNICVLCVRRVAACCASVLQLTWQVFGASDVGTKPDRHGARPDRCGAMSLKEQHPIGSLSGDMFRWIRRRWSPMTPGSHLSRFFLRLFITLPPLLLLLFTGLWWFGPAGFCTVLPGVNITGWTADMEVVPGLSSLRSFLFSQSQTAEGAVDEPGLDHSPSPGAEAPPPQVVSQEVSTETVSADSEGRLVQVEESLTSLWQQVEAAGRQAEQRHTEVLQLYADLQQQQPPSSPSRGDGVELWLSGLMDQQLVQLRGQLDEERRYRERIRQQDLLMLKTQTSRLDHLELQLKRLAARTLEVQWTAEGTTTLPASVSTGMDRHSHDALQAEVLRLRATLGDVRRNVQVLSGCQNGCRQLNRIHQMISEQVSIRVREEVQGLIHGNQLTSGGEAAAASLLESLLQSLSERFISELDLQEALSSLELKVLQNISRQLQQHGEKTVRGAVLDAAGNDGKAVTKEDVHEMVTDALRLFSQDRIGLADYALESGGGSILSTRCSETYETKAALLSLFGVPLWHFSQSPRAVIQPDIHPGNCWAFKGSTGFLVIRLSMRIFPTAVTMEHIPKSLAPSGKLHSAPRDFSVYGLRNESQEGGKLLGTFTYEEDGEDLQTFGFSGERDESFQIIEVQVLSNWGHPEYTCMYRFRVHGTPSDA